MKKISVLLVAAAFGLAIQVSTAAAFNPQPDPPKTKAKMGVPPHDTKAKRKIGNPPDDSKAKMGAPIQEKPGARGGQVSGGPIIDRGGPKSGGPIMDKGPGSDAAAKGLLPAVQSPSAKQR
jgi:hypothetical protein